jgi:hypothetical protein
VLYTELIYTMELAKKDDFSFEKGLDVFENEPLLHYIKYGRHLQGASSNVVKRVLKNANFYRFDGKNILSKNKSGGSWKIVPEPGSRFELIKSEHLIGHFMVKSTLDRLDKDYFWRRMKEDIEHVIKQCELCASNEKVRIYNHPAYAIPISGIFDMVGADLVFGLPETEEGYVGIIVLTDAFTKFPYAKPIKSKSAIEIAEKLRKYICLFGPLKILLTDFGKEINIELLDTMLSNIGVEHKSTTSFNPRSNG